MRFSNLPLRLLTTLALIICSGCAGSTSPQATAINSNEESYFILGFHPNNMMLTIEEGHVTKTGAISLHTNFPHFYGQNESGYILGKATGGKIYGIKSASRMRGNTIFGKYYKADKGALIFKIEPGKVVYVGDVSFEDSGSELKPRRYRDIDGARSFLREHYPALADKLVQGELDVAPVSQ